MRGKTFTLFILAVLMSTGLLYAQTARVQIIHNSADAAADSVDIYLDGSLLLDNFAFRNATPYIDAPAGVAVDVGVAPQTSTSVDDTIFNASVTFTENETYVVVANGIISGSGYSPHTDFDLYVYSLGQEGATTAGQTDVLVFHGATDAPTVDVAEPNVPTKLLDDLSYGEFTADYLNLATADYSLQVQDQTGQTAVAQFAAPLQTLGLEDSALVVVASGFLDPSNNSDGPAFGLWAALPSGGELVQLPAENIATANVQVVHNSADLAAASVDVWMNDQVLLDDFAFRTASPFVELTAGVNFDITIQGASSTDTTNGLWRRNYSLAAGENYLLVASGIVSGSGYSPAEPFDIYVFEGARLEAEASGNTDILGFHGSTDAPPVDVVEPALLLQYADNFSYGSFTDDYTGFPTMDYSLQVQDSTGRSAVAQFSSPLETLGLEDSALVVLASGFLDPSSNSDGPAFGLYAALPSGGELVELPLQELSTAQAQLIHNSPDVAADTVDVWLNDQLLADDFAFRNATPFVEATAGVLFDISVQPKNSTDTVGALYKETAIAAADKKYVIIANGIVSPSGYDPAREFGLFVWEEGRTEADEAGNTDILGFHGATDAPTVDITEPNLPLKLQDDLSYGSFTEGYLDLETADYSLQVQDSTGRSVVAQYGAPLETLDLEDSALVVVASGFLDPASNSDGAAFGLYVALPSGGEMIELPTESSSTTEVQLIHNSPDAAADTVDIYIDDELLINDFAFRNASSFIEVPAGTIFDVSVQPKTSTDTVGALFKESVMVGAANTYVVIASGTITSGYDPAREFGFHAYEMGRKMASEAGQTDVLVFHGSTDAPVVDVKEPSALLGLVDNLEYGQFTANYLGLPTADYSLQVQDSTGRTAVAQFGAPLETLGLEDSALVVVASGFLTPANNNDGPAFGLYAALPAGGELVELPAEDISQARAQVIHNSADLAADTVDVWYNDQVLLDDFAFRNASPYVDLTAGVEFDITIQPMNSADTTDGLWRKAYSLAAGKHYILIANGIVSTSGYDPAEPFDIYVNDTGQMEAAEAGNTDVMVFHGSTDAPTVDVTEPFEQLTLVDNLSYGSFTDGYLGLATSNYQLQIQNEFGSEAVAQFAAPLTDLSLEDSALIVVASGFLNPANNNDGPGFGLYAALPSGGEMVELPAGDVSKAMVQVIHNSADAAASTVDVWLNDTPLLDDFAFRTASPFVSLTAGTNLDISIQPSSSTDTVDALAKFSYQLLPDEKYVLIASGLVSSSGYDPVEPFDLDVFQGARTQASQIGYTDVLVYHGATDAPIVDIYESSVPAGTLVDNLAYGAYSEDYLELSTDNYVLDVQDESGSTTVAQYEANLSDLGLADSALVALASGFLEPDNNSDGPAFGLFVALPSGGNLLELPEYEEPTSLEDRLSELTRMRVYPNPVSSELIIDVHNDAGSPVTVELYNVMGQKMATPFDKRELKGHQVLRYDVSNLAEGLYFVILSDGNSRITRKIKIIK